MTMTPNLRALRNEAAHLPGTLDDAVLLRRRLLEAGNSRASTDGCIGWLIAKAAGDTDATDANARARYRRMLAELDSPTGPNRPAKVRGGKRVCINGPSSPATKAA